MQPEVGSAPHLFDEMNSLVGCREMVWRLLSQDVCHLLDFLIRKMPTEEKGMDGCFAELHQGIILICLGNSTSLDPNASAFPGLVNVPVINILLSRV